MKIAAIVIGIVVILVGGYFAYWAVVRDSTNRRADVNRTTYEYQQTIRSTLARRLSDIADIDTQAVLDESPQLRAQRKAIVAEMCAMADQISGDVPPRIVAFTVKEC